MKWQVHYIQVLLADELDRCKEKGDNQVKEYIKIIQKAYQELYQYHMPSLPVWKTHPYKNTLVNI